MNTFEPSLAQKIYGRIQGVRPPGILPKKARKLLRQVQNEPITSLVVIQKPIENVVRWLMNRSGISPEQIIDEMQVDDLYHTSLWINGRYLYEKQHVIKFRECTETQLTELSEILNPETGVTLDVSYVLGGMRPTFVEFFYAHRQFMGWNTYTSYASVRNNCQHFVIRALEAWAHRSGVELDNLDHDRILQAVGNIDPRLYERMERTLDRCVACWRRREVVMNGVR